MRYINLHLTYLLTYSVVRLTNICCIYWSGFYADSAYTLSLLLQQQY